MDNSHRSTQWRNPDDSSSSTRVQRNAPTTSPIFNNPFVSTANSGERHTVDSPSSNDYDNSDNGYGYTNMNRVSAVPFVPQHATIPGSYSTVAELTQQTAAQENEQRRTSDETLAEYVAPDQYLKVVKDDDYDNPKALNPPPQQPYRPSTDRSRDANARRNGRSYDIENPVPDFDVSRGNNPRMSDVEHANLRRGFFDHVKGTLKRWARDTDGEIIEAARNSSCPTSRRNSWSGAQPSQQMHSGTGRSRAQSLSIPDERRDNFTQSMAHNEDFEETYLLDDDGHHRSVREAVFHNPHLRLTPNYRQNSATQIQGDRRKSYSERRKRAKHRITHCAEPVEEYQKFILIFAKALLIFGSPSHRIEAQLNSLAKVFEIEAQFQHTPGTIQISFGNPETQCSETCLIKAPVGLALSRIFAMHNIYRAVLHDDMYASQGTHALKKLLASKPHYGNKTRSALSFITCLLICGVAFGGSLNDMWVAGIMGLVVRTMQNIASKSELSASGSEVFTAAIVSLVARALSTVPSQIWCFTAISSSGIISLLPGYLILSGSLDIAGKNQALGAPKIVSGIMTSLYLGFGLTLGSDVFLFLDRPARRFLLNNDHLSTNMTIIQGYFTAMNGTSPSDNFTGTFSFINASDASLTRRDSHIVQGCYRDPNWGWYLQPMPFWTLSFLVPLFAFCASMSNQQHWWSRQMLVMVTIACISFWITRVCNVYWGLHDHPDYVSLIGSWFVGILGNGYSRRFGGTAFTAMLTGVLLLVPDGLAAAGGLSQNYQNQGQDEYTQSLTLARKMISVIIGIMAGVYSSAAIIYLFGKKKNAALVTF